MADTEALLGYNTLYEIKDAGGAYAIVGEVTEVTPPNEQASDVVATHLRSPDRKHEYIPGFIEPGEASLSINWIPGNPTDVLLQDLKVSGARRMHRITWPNGVAWEFTGYVKGFEPSAPIDDRMTATVTLKVSGSTAITPAAAPANVLKPAVSGVPQVGVELTALDGTWNGGPTLAYQWQANGGSWTNISGATGKTYTPVVGQVGQPLRVGVVATNSLGAAAVVYSGATANVLAA